MAGAFKASLTLPSSISPFLFKPSPFSSPITKILVPKSHFIVPPITITRANNGRTESTTAIVVDSDVEDDDEDYDDDDDEDDEEFMAFEDMRKWELSKPAGFGEGKVYDTTVEGKLLEEMERGRAAQIAAGKKKKQEQPSHPQPQSQMDFVTSGPCVRLENLPKKKNIHRDLQAAFKGFKGIVSISPANIGNRKTRDPICKGFAFVEFTSKEAAFRFVSTFSQQDIIFGKLQKKISFDVINSEQLVTSTQTLAPPKFMNVGAEKQEVIGMSMTNKTVKGPAVLMNGTTVLLSDSEKDQSKQIASKKKVVKKKPAKSAKPSLPSSMTRLQVKERGVLAGVFTKYGGKVASVSD